MTAVRIALAAKKGGVGKSTCAINIAGYLAKRYKQRVLVVDTDSQSSTSQFFMKPEQVDALKKEETIAALFDPACGIDKRKIIHPTHIENLFFAPASDHLARHTLPCPQETGDLQFVLRDFLREVSPAFSFIIMDTPPLLETLPTWNCMLASHFILAPLAMEKFALQAISGLQQNIAAAQEINKRLHFLGYVVNQYDARRGMHKGNLTKLRRTHGDQVLETTLSNLNAYSEAQMLRTPITHFDKAGRAATDTIALFNEVIGRIEAHMKKMKSQQPATKQQTARRVV